MPIYENLTTFAGKPVRDFDVAKGIMDVDRVVYRLRVPWDLYEQYAYPNGPARILPKKGLWNNLKGLFGSKNTQNPRTPSFPSEKKQKYESAFQDVFASFLADPNSNQIQELIIGDWGGSGEGNNSKLMIQELVQAHSKLPNLTKLFIGDIIVEECEISWIEHSDISPLWQVYPNLEFFRVRGGNGLSLGRLYLGRLKALIIETGGMPGPLLDQVCKAELPMIEHLELWLGEDGYGWSGSLEQLKPILEGKIFPNLKYLGLRDSEEADGIAELIGSITLPRSLEVLDLSLGTLSDQGALALANSPQLNRLRMLDLHHHYISKDGQNKLRKLTCNINLDDPQPDDEDGGTKYRYVAVSE